MDEKENVYQVYNKIANWFANNRPKNLIEKSYLDKLKQLIPTGAAVLDLGCGDGKPILEYLLKSGLNVTGIDASEKMLALAKQNFPMVNFQLKDMRKLKLDEKFNAIIAWHSFFHLPAEDQPQMFEIFSKHLFPNGILLFTSGTENGESWGMNRGQNLFHASLDTEEYLILFKNYNFEILSHTVNDPSCGGATVWLAQFKPQ